MRTNPPDRPGQGAFDDLGQPLNGITFVVVDLETTGGLPQDAGVTEIGAVKVRGGEVLGEFATLVNPGIAIPPFIAALTGITNALLTQAPPLRVALPMFLDFADFADGAVLVAHNAPYDVGFLKGGCAVLGLSWPAPAVLDTVRLARRVLGRDEVPNCKLATLAQHFRASTRPTHRALDDARATVDVLHGLMERVGAEGVHSWSELSAYNARVSTEQRRKRGLAAHLPETPGVYVFRGSDDRPLYVGTSGNIRARVRTYFTASEQRTAMARMVAAAERVTAIECATSLEAQVREIRLIEEYRPRFNRRSRTPERSTWIRLTAEPFPRLSIVRALRPSAISPAKATGAARRRDSPDVLVPPDLTLTDLTLTDLPFAGPFAGRVAAQAAADALLAAIPLRTCTQRLSRMPQDTPSARACARAELGTCRAPCDGSQSRPDYLELVASAHAVLTGVAVGTVVEPVLVRMAALSAQQRYEDAARWRERLTILLRGLDRAHALRQLSSMRELVAARPRPDNGWDVHVLRFGRLAAAGTIPPGRDPRPVVDALVATAEQPAVDGPGAAVRLPEETLLLHRWLLRDGVRLVRSDGPLLSPTQAPGRFLAELTRGGSPGTRSDEHPLAARRPSGRRGRYDPGSGSGSGSGAGAGAGGLIAFPASARLGRTQIALSRRRVDVTLG